MSQNDVHEQTKSRVLVFRLSSMGDVILSLAAAESARERAGPGVSLREGASAQWDWVTSAEYASLITRNPAVRQVWSVDRRGSERGLGGWRRFCRRLWEEEYELVLDLHRSSRTRLARFLFAYWGLKARLSGGAEGKRRPTTRWRVVSKQRLRQTGYFLFKGAWPRSWRPLPWAARFRELGLLVRSPGDRQLAPAQGADLAYLLPGRGREEWAEMATALLRARSPNWTMGSAYLGVMPGARWEGKQWAAEKYGEVLRRFLKQGGAGSLIPVVLGAPGEAASIELVKYLRREGLEHVDAVGAWTLEQVAAVLKGAVGYFGSDTGLAHLAEALGTPSLVLFGPTAPDAGFGPWRKESRSVGSDLWCRPCSKDGSACFRPRRRYLCMSSLSVDRVANDLSDWLMPRLRAAESREGK